ncbi:IS1/IS1595 family N-terminal zinc-binding domain-containing protein, partial [Corynebacterium pseudogenitalium]|uniref:IS1/IS1595 family N-terminal zinc-binding domain-containing protein n=1 Tax=Corynebacterium pseudogenitalium TaxID=38303 RepID=UPI003F6F9878
MPTQHRKRKHNRPLCPACEHTATKMGTTSSGKQRWRCTDCGHTFTNPNTAKTSAYRFAIFIDWITNQRPLDAVGLSDKMCAFLDMDSRSCLGLRWDSA